MPSKPEPDGAARRGSGLTRQFAVDELGGQPVVLATGGLSHLMFTVCETLDHQEPDLKMVGLLLV